MKEKAGSKCRAKKFRNISGAVTGLSSARFRVLGYLGVDHGQRNHTGRSTNHQHISYSIPEETPKCAGAGPKAFKAAAHATVEHRISPPQSDPELQKGHVTKHFVAIAARPPRPRVWARIHMASASLKALHCGDHACLHDGRQLLAPNWPVV